MSRKPHQTIEALALKMHRARTQAETLRKQMAKNQWQARQTAASLGFGSL